MYDWKVIVIFIPETRDDIHQFWKLYVLHIVVSYGCLCLQCSTSPLIRGTFILCALGKGW